MAKTPIKHRPTADELYRLIFNAHIEVPLIIIGYILNKNYKDINYSPISMLTQLAISGFTDAKTTIFDFLGLFDNIYAIFECQNKVTKSFYKRIHHYCHVLGAAILRKGMDYILSKNIMSVSLLNGILFEEKGFFVSEKTELSNEYPEYFGCAQNYYFQLPLFKFNLENATMADFIFAFFKAETWEDFDYLKFHWERLFGTTDLGGLMTKLVATVENVNNDDDLFARLHESINSKSLADEIVVHINTIENDKKIIEEKDKKIEEKDKKIEEKDKKIEDMSKKLEEKDKKIEDMSKNIEGIYKILKVLAKMVGKNDIINEEMTKLIPR